MGRADLHHWRFISQIRDWDALSVGDGDSPGRSLRGKKGKKQENTSRCVPCFCRWDFTLSNIQNFILSPFLVYFYVIGFIRTHKSFSFQVDMVSQSNGPTTSRISRNSFSNHIRKNDSLLNFAWLTCVRRFVKFLIFRASTHTFTTKAGRYIDNSWGGQW